jgi:hypothetical protein
MIWNLVDSRSCYIKLFSLLIFKIAENLTNLTALRICYIDNITDDCVYKIEFYN